MRAQLTIEYVAFLRGINVGGNHKVLMDELAEELEDLGLDNVKTVIASGNVSFEAGEADEEKLQADMETALEKRFGFAIGVIVRKMEELKQLIGKKPFAAIKVTPQTRLYVTFLQKKPKYPKELGLKTSHKNFRIVDMLEREVLSVVVITADARGTTEGMKWLEKTFGKNVTTRNWNTVVKIADA